MCARGEGEHVVRDVLRPHICKRPVSFCLLTRLRPADGMFESPRNTALLRPDRNEARTIKLSLIGRPLLDRFQAAQFESTELLRDDIYGLCRPWRSSNIAQCGLVTLQHGNRHR